MDFDLAAGEIHALLGENGAGKSTLIRRLTGACSRDGGEIMLDGRPISPRSTSEAQDLGIGTVYQEVNLLPNLTVAQNLMFGREPTRWGLVDGRVMRAQAQEMLAGYTWAGTSGTSRSPSSRSWPSPARWRCRARC